MMFSSEKRRSRWTVVVALAAAASLAAAPAVSASATTPSAAPARSSSGHPPPGVQAALDQVVAAGAPGAIALVRMGDRTYRFSSGYGNLAPLTPIRVGELSRIGGVTKSYTATVVLQLVGKRVLKLNDTVEKWLPGVFPNGEGITIRQLLNHTSGIFDYVQDDRVFAPYLGGDLTLPFDPREGVRIAAEHDPLFAPGTGWSYSNTNYLLLAMIVEKATGHSIGSELRSRIFKPLGLDHTSYPTTSEIRGSYIHGYWTIFGPEPTDFTPLSPTLLGAAGAILASADDVARFYRALLRGRLLKPGVLKAMQTIDPVADEPPGAIDAGIPGGGWGLGLLRETFPCGEAWGHDSEIPGYTTAAWNSKDGTRQVVVVVNMDGFPHDHPVPTAMRNVLAKAYCGS
ncbi:serine hydrolase domain-containing protein [Kribbella sp. NPDC026596]|uniref:serine hydrolase domain-containing protein n=1 Tax=Kribbella sp. NPDC026596 TaxID=3155122 RepID=UPI0033D3DBEF